MPDLSGGYPGMFPMTPLNGRPLQSAPIVIIYKIYGITILNSGFLF